MSEFPFAAQEWWERSELAQIWAGTEAGDEDDGWSSHVDKAKDTLDSGRPAEGRTCLPWSAGRTLSLLRTPAGTSRLPPDWGRYGLHSTRREFLIGVAAAPAFHAASADDELVRVLSVPQQWPQVAERGRRVVKKET